MYITLYVNINMNSNNNTNSNGKLVFNPTGLKQSQIILHYKGLGIGYGNMNHWWGEGFHSSIALTSNSPSQKTFSLGTFRNVKLGKLLLYSKFGSNAKPNNPLSSAGYQV